MPEKREKSLRGSINLLIKTYTMETTVVDFKANLDEFTGTFQYHEHRLANLYINLTDGCDYVRKEAKAYWLFDAILSHQITNMISNHSFQV